MDHTVARDNGGGAKFCCQELAMRDRDQNLGNVGLKSYVRRGAVELEAKGKALSESIISQKTEVRCRMPE